MVLRAGPVLPPQPARRHLDQRDQRAERVAEVARGGVGPAVVHGPADLGQQPGLGVEQRIAGRGQLRLVHPDQRLRSTERDRWASIGWCSARRARQSAAVSRCMVRRIISVRTSTRCSSSRLGSAGSRSAEPGEQPDVGLLRLLRLQPDQVLDGRRSPAGWIVQQQVARQQARFSARCPSTLIEPHRPIHDQVRSAGAPIAGQPPEPVDQPRHRAR